MIPQFDADVARSRPRWPSRAMRTGSHGDAGGRAQGARRRHLERRRRRQPGADRHVAVDHARRMPATADAARASAQADARHVVRTSRAAAGARARRGRPRASRRRRASAARSSPSRARRGRDDGPAVDRHRQHEAVVVVGVLADQVHAARRRGEPRRIAGKTGRSPRARGRASSAETSLMASGSVFRPARAAARRRPRR